MQTQTQKKDGSADYGKVVGPATVCIKRLLSASPEKVWSYLTETEKSALWLCALEGDVKDGGRIKMVFDNSNLTPHQEETPDEFKEHACSAREGNVTSYEPYTRFAYTWGMDEHASEVMFELEAQGDKTLLTVTHSKLPDEGSMVGVSSGWHAHLDVLRDRIQGLTPAPFWSNFMDVREEYRSMIKA